MSLRILFIEPFYGGSHRAFADGLARHSGHHIKLLTLPGGEWRRRMRRGAQELAAKAATLEGDFDLLVATDMLDLPVFLALTRPRFDRTPVLYYLHENQFTYPRLRGTTFNSWFGQINYLSARAADAVAFNSAFHQAEFFHALESLAAQPNNWLVAENIALIRSRSEVLPVGVELGWLDSARPESCPPGPPLVLWNHRWEFDKAPELFVRVLQRLAYDGVDFRVAVCGEPGDNPVDDLVRLPELLPGRVIHHGYAPDRETYARLLWNADIVASTSRHEFFGMSTIEALYCGCWPVLPARQNYPALVPPDLHDRCLWEGEAAFEAQLRAAIEHRPADERLRQHSQQFDWRHVASLWDDALERLAHQAGSPGGLRRPDA